ncbi:hypothetical protein PG997_014340 [Apiospora hydei]|uniref:Uncharacterized protein n=1 Tax=Apiospora hydei TaxID=1337664 RepID=A0ABR1UTI1_9PEZI
MFKTSSSRLLLPLLLAAVAESANVCTYEGGWSLRQDAQFCPINAPVNCGNGIQLRCCPNGLTCRGRATSGATGVARKAKTAGRRHPRAPRTENMNKQCPDPTWTLWGGDGTLKNGGWCCQPGDNGFYRGSVDAVGCTAAGVRSLPTGYHFASTVATVACVSPTSSAASSTATGNGASATPTSIGDTDSDSDKTSSSLSGGAIAGIVVGAMCGMGLIAGIFALAWYRKKRARNQNDAAAAAAAGGAYGSPGMDTTSELGGVQRHEMGSGRPEYHEIE